MPSNLDQAHQDRAESQAAFAAGHVRFIELLVTERPEDEKWPSVRRGLFDLAARHAFQGLGPKDMVLRAKEGFLVVFADPDPARAALMCEQISTSLTERFREDPLLGALGVQACERSLARGELSEMLDSDLAIERNVVRKKGSDSVATRLQGIDAKDRYWAYQPVWDSHGESVTSATAVARASLASGEFYGRGLLLGDATARDQAGLDLQAIEAVKQEFDNAVAINGSAAVCVGVHIDGLAGSESRNDYLKLLEDLGEERRDNFHLLVEGIGRATSASRMRDAVSPLVRLGFKVGIRVPLNMPSLDGLRGSGIKFVSTDWPEEGQDLQMNMLVELVEHVSRLNIFASIYGVADKLTLRQVVAAGARRIAGPVIGDLLPNLPEPKPARLAHFLRDKAA